MAQGIYLDNSMTTRPSDHTISQMLPFFNERWGHPSSPHQMGQDIYPALKESYKAIYTMLGASERDDFVFTSSGAEAVNHVIFSAYHDITRTTGKNHFVASNSEEAPALMAIGRLEHLSCVGKMVHVNAQGKVTAEAIAETITPRTALISLSWANGLTGIIHPVAEIAGICRERGIALHLDATHILGKLFYEMEEVGATFITFNGDHLHAPKGTGGLWIKAGTKCSPFILGGIEQGGHRAGSYNIPGLVGLGHAATELMDSRNLLSTEIARLRNKLEEGIVEGLSESVVFFQQEERLPNITCIGFPGIANEALLYALNRKGVYASIGGGSFQQVGLVLAATGVPETLAQTAISFSLSRETSEEAIDHAIEIVVETAKKLRKMSKSIVS